MSVASVAAVVGDGVRLIVPGLRRRVPGFSYVPLVRRVVFRSGGCRCFVCVFRSVSGVCDTPVDVCVRKGFRGVRGVWVCVFAVCGVSFSLAAAQRSVRLGPGS